MSTPILVPVKDAPKFMARYTQEVIRRAAAKRASDTHTEPSTPLEWAHAYRQIEGQPFSLERFRPLQELYADCHQHIVVIKPAQRGVSEYAISYAGFALDIGASVWAPPSPDPAHKEGLNVGYFFPTKEALGDFSKERVSSLADEGSHLAALFGGEEDAFSAVTFKQVGKSYWYLRGTNSEAGLLSFPADVLIFDEFDRMDRRAVAIAMRRLNASTVRRVLKISTPTRPQSGIHGEWLASDQRVWLNRCAACNSEAQLDFLRDVRADGEPFPKWRHAHAEQLVACRFVIVCPVCHTELDPCGPGRWVAQRPEVSRVRGYWVPPLAFPFVDLCELAQRAVAPSPSEQEQFHQMDLGLPYEVSGSRITEAMLLRCTSELPELPPYGDVTLGVDVGAELHYRVSGTNRLGRRQVLSMGTTTWVGLDVLMREYRPRQVVIDALPELEMARSFQSCYPGRVLRALYPNSADFGGKLFRVDETEGVVQVHRTGAMDAVLAEYGRDLVLPPEYAHDPQIVAQLRAPVRTMQTDERTGQSRGVWTHNPAEPDHWFHASVYDHIACGVLVANRPERASGVAARAFHGWQPGAVATTTTPSRARLAGGRLRL